MWQNLDPPSDLDNTFSLKKILEQSDILEEKNVYKVKQWWHFGHLPYCMDTDDLRVGEMQTTAFKDWEEE